MAIRHMTLVQPLRAHDNALEGADARKGGVRMKRVALVALMIAALVFGVVAYASGSAEDVVVTARVNPAFSMTINQNAVNFLDVALGSAYSDNTTMITVKSNKLWDFSKGSVVAPLLVPLLTESTDVAVGVGKSKGVTDITAKYDLNLAGDAAYELDPAPASYSATYTYTAVQQ